MTNLGAEAKHGHPHLDIVGLKHCRIESEGSAAAVECVF